MSSFPFPCCLALNHRDATSRPVRAANCNCPPDINMPVLQAYSQPARSTHSIAHPPGLERAQQAAESRIESSLRDTLPACSSQLSAGVKLVEKRSHRRAPTCSRARCVGDPVPGTSEVPRRATPQGSFRPMRAVRLWGQAAGGRQRALAQLQVSLDIKAGPANDVHVCRPRGVVWRRECPKIHCSERLCRASRRGSGCRVE